MEQSTNKQNSINEYINQTFEMDHQSNTDSAASKCLNIENISLNQLNNISAEPKKQSVSLSTSSKTIEIDLNPNPFANDRSKSEKTNANFLFVDWSKFSRIYSLVLAVLSTVSITLSIFLVKTSIALNASDMALLKFSTQILLCLPFAICFRENLLGPKDQRWLLIGRGAAGAVSLLTAYFSIKMINFSDTIAIRYSSPIITIILAHLFLGEKFKKLNVSHTISLLMVVLGLLCIIRPSIVFGRFGQNTRTERSFDFIVGTSLAVICAFSASSSFIFIKKIFLHQRDGSQMNFSIFIFYFSTIGLVLSFIISTIIYLISFDLNSFQATKSHILKDVCVGLFAGFVNFFGQFCFNLALNRENTSKVSYLKTVDILVAFLIDYFVLNITPHWLNLLGAFLILSSVLTIFLFKFIRSMRVKKQADKESDYFEIRL